RSVFFIIHSRTPKLDGISNLESIDSLDEIEFDD
ncbi:replication protein RepA, partial [Pantoea agglomerans]